ncbi:MAG: hypothetical protein WCX16_04690 [Candidatus Omnitrophota bacterium]|jgi:hypothetical protein
MKQGLSFLIVVVMMLIFGIIFFLKLDAWEKRVKAEVLSLASQACQQAFTNQVE